MFIFLGETNNFNCLFWFEITLLEASSSLIGYCKFVNRQMRKALFVVCDWSKDQIGFGFSASKISGGLKKKLINLRSRDSC